MYILISECIVILTCIYGCSHNYSELWPGVCVHINIIWNKKMNKPLSEAALKMNDIYYYLYYGCLVKNLFNEIQLTSDTMIVLSAYKFCCVKMKNVLAVIEIRHIIHFNHSFSKPRHQRWEVCRYDCYFPVYLFMFFYIYCNAYWLSDPRCALSPQSH